MNVFMVLCWQGQFKQTRPTAANAVTADLDTTTAADLAVCNELCGGLAVLTVLTMQVHSRDAKELDVPRML